LGFIQFSLVEGGWFTPNLVDTVFSVGVVVYILHLVVLNGNLIIDLNYIIDSNN